jgi:hypothetical protein
VVGNLTSQGGRQDIITLVLEIVTRSTGWAANGGGRQMLYHRQDDCVPASALRERMLTEGQPFTRDHGWVGHGRSLRAPFPGRPNLQPDKVVVSLNLGLGILRACGASLRANSANTSLCAVQLELGSRAMHVIFISLQTPSTSTLRFNQVSATGTAVVPT